MKVHTDFKELGWSRVTRINAETGMIEQDRVKDGVLIERRYTDLNDIGIMVALDAMGWTKKKDPKVLSS